MEQGTVGDDDTIIASTSTSDSWWDDIKVNDEEPRRSNIIID